MGLASVAAKADMLKAPTTVAATREDISLLIYFSSVYMSGYAIADRNCMVVTMQRHAYTKLTDAALILKFNSQAVSCRILALYVRLSA